MARRWRGPHHSFTLVELLVVVAIIAILAAVSFSGIMSALSRAKIAKCASNLRQLGVGFDLYLQDNNNQMPYEGSTLTFAGKDGTTYGGPNSVRWLNPYIGQPSTASPVLDVPVCHDPADSGTPSTGVPSNYNAYGNSYYINFYTPVGQGNTTLRAPSGTGPFSMLRVKNPTQTILFFCAGGYNYYSGIRNIAWHSTGTNVTANFCFVDGHVEYLTVRNPSAAANPGDPAYPDTVHYQWEP